MGKKNKQVPRKNPNAPTGFAPIHDLKNLKKTCSGPKQLANVKRWKNYLKRNTGKHGGVGTHEPNELSIEQITGMSAKQYAKKLRSFKKSNELYTELKSLVSTTKIADYWDDDKANAGMEGWDRDKLVADIEAAEKANNSEDSSFGSYDSGVDYDDPAEEEKFVKKEVQRKELEHLLDMQKRSRDDEEERRKDMRRSERKEKMKDLADRKAVSQFWSQGRPVKRYCKDPRTQNYSGAYKCQECGTVCKNGEVLAKHMDSRGCKAKKKHKKKVEKEARREAQRRINALKVMRAQEVQQIRDKTQAQKARSQKARPRFNVQQMNMTPLAAKSVVNPTVEIESTPEPVSDAGEDDEYADNADTVNQDSVIVL